MLRRSYSTVQESIQSILVVSRDTSDLVAQGCLSHQEHQTEKAEQ